MLSNLLPGFRHARTPVTAGTLWLLVLWLVLGEAIAPDRAGNRVERLLYDLPSVFGDSIVVAGAVGVALILGASVPPLPLASVPRRLPINQGGWKFDFINALFGSNGQVAYLKGEFEFFLFRRCADLPDNLPWSVFSRLDCPNDVGVWARDVQEAVVADSPRGALVGRQKLDSIEVEQLGDDPTSWLRWTFTPEATEVEVRAELPVRLRRSGNEGLFDDFDRKRAEGELRASIALPLALLSLVLATGWSWWWLVLLLGALWLIRDGVKSFAEAENVLRNAVRFGDLESTTVEFIRSLSMEPIGYRRERSAD